MFFVIPETVGGVLEPNHQLRLFDKPRMDLSALLVETDRDPSEYLVAQSATALQFLVALGAITESVHELELRTIADALANIDEVTALASRIARLDVTQALLRGPQISETRIMSANQAPAATLDVAARSIMSVVALCPIERIERLARQRGDEATGHEARVAYDWLQAFVRRHHPHSDRKAHVACRAYAEGRLSVTEVGDLLGMAASDAVFHLETHGFCRTIDSQRLIDDARAEILRRLRSDRLRRNGAAEPSEQLIARDVIASERIESIDARSWMAVQPLLPAP